MVRQTWPRASALQFAGPDGQAKGGPNIFFASNPEHPGFIVTFNGGNRNILVKRNYRETTILMRSNGIIELTGRPPLHITDLQAFLPVLQRVHEAIGSPGKDSRVRYGRKRGLI